jgi:hypothetical protein
MGNRSIHYLLVILLVIVSVAGRVGNLDAFSPSNDEGAYLMWAWLVHSGHPLYSETMSVSAPLFIVFLDWSFDLTGVSLVTGRALVLGFLCLAMLSLAWIGELQSQRLAGLAAALIFSLAPLSFALSRMAMGEMPAVALATGSLALALAYRRGGRRRWLALSGLAFGLSLLVKTLSLALVLPVIWLILARHWSSPARPHRILADLAVWGLAGLLPICIVLLVYNPARLYDQAVAFRFEVRRAFPWGLADHSLRLSDFVQQHWGILGLALAGVALLVVRARWETLVWLGLWLAGGFLSVWFHSPLFWQHIIILLPPLALLAGLGFAETVALMRERRWAWGGLGLAGGLLFILALPGVVRANQTAQAVSFGREAEAIAFLEQITYPTDQVISDNLLLPFMAGRQTPPPLGDLAQVAIDSGRQTSQRLIAISEDYPVQAVANWALRLPYLEAYMDWVESNFLVRRAWDDYHVIYFGRRVLADQIPHHLEARLGEEIELLGYDVQRGRQVAGGRPDNLGGAVRTLDVTLYWRTATPVKDDLTVFVQLLDPAGRLVTQHDGQPLHGYLPTGSWSPGDLIPDRHQLPLPEDLLPGRYRLIAGMYALTTLERLPVRTAQGAADYVLLTEIELGD